MSELNKMCDKLYGTTIRNINIDIIKRSIEIQLAAKNEGKGECILEMRKVSSFMWLDSFLYNDEEFDFSNWDYYELTTIDIMNITTFTHDKWLSQYPMEYNIAIEIWDTALLVNAKEIIINQQCFTLPG